MSLVISLAYSLTLTFNGALDVIWLVQSRDVLDEKLVIQLNKRRELEVPVADRKGLEWTRSEFAAFVAKSSPVMVTMQSRSTMGFAVMNAILKW